MFSHLLRCLTTHLGTVPHAGFCTKKVRSLAPFGIPVGAGISTRPLLLAGSDTETVLPQLHTVSHQTFRGSQLHLTGPARWSGWANSFFPTYPPSRGPRHFNPSTGPFPAPHPSPSPRAIPVQPPLLHQPPIYVPSTSSPVAVLQPPKRDRSFSPAAARPALQRRRLAPRPAVPPVPGPRTAAAALDVAPRPLKRCRHGRGNPEARER